MIPSCRTLDEGRRVIAAMAAHGLRQGDAGLEIYAMCEVPSNVVLAEEFLRVFDGFSIGSNDLTQLNRDLVVRRRPTIRSSPRGWSTRTSIRSH